MAGELRNEAQAQIEARLKEEALARIFRGLSTWKASLLPWEGASTSSGSH